jgi:hypothetical protein
MLWLPHIVANDHSAVFLAPVVIGQRLERLAVASGAPGDRDLHELNRAVQVLHAVGLLARVVADPARIVGGRREIELDGLTAYEDSFALWRDPNGQYQVAMSGHGNLETHSASTNLDELLSFLARQYADRPPARR